MGSSAGYWYCDEHRYLVTYQRWSYHWYWYCVVSHLRDFGGSTHRSSTDSRCRQPSERGAPDNLHEPDDRLFREPDLAIASAWVANASITLTGSCILNITGLLPGGNYVLVVTQGAGGSNTLSLGSGCTWKVSNGGGGAVTPTATAGAIDVMAFTGDGTNCYVQYNTNFN